MNVSVETPPAPSEDLLFSPAAPEPTPAPAATHASSSGSGMSDERNADSVLFKVDTLQNVAKAQAEARANGGATPSRQLARLAAQAPASEGSGLIDVKTLASTVASPEQGSHAGSSSSSVTSSAALSQSLLSSSSMLASLPETNATSPAPTAPSRTPLIVLSVLAILALGAAIAAIVLRG